MAEYLIQGETLESMADEIRILNGVEGALTTAQMDSNLSEANDEVDSQADLIAQIANALEGKAGGSGIEQATPVISINSTNGLITATAGAKTSTHQLAFQSAKTIIPSTASQIAVSSGYYTGGNVVVAAVPTQTKSVTPKATSQDVTPDSGKLLSKVTVAGDSNLVAGNIKSGVSIFGVNGTLEEGGGGEQVEWSEYEDAIINKTLSSYFNDRIKSINSYAFYGCKSLTTVSFPVCTTVSDYAFYNCSSLTTVSFPACTTIGSYAFYSCSSLTTVSFPACTTICYQAFYGCRSLTTVSFPVCTIISTNAFRDCRSLTTVNFPACTTISANAFYGCKSLTTVSFPVCTTVSDWAFYSCSSLTTVSFPACTTICYQAFYGCRSLTTVSFPSCTAINGYAFYNCSSLTTVSFPVCNSIGSYTFQNCCNLKSLYLTGSSLCTLSNSNAFSSTPIGGYSASTGTYGNIYVPASLLASYQKATNWVYFSSRFVAYGGGITGGFDD